SLFPHIASIDHSFIGSANTMRNQTLTVKRLLASLAAVGAVGGGAAIAIQHSQPAVGSPAPAPVNPAPGAPAPVPAPTIALPDVSVIASRNGPAVVNISTVGSTKAAYQQRGGERADPFGDDPFFEFFRRFQGPQQRGRDMPTHGVGSGFIVSADGVIL